MFTLIIVIYLTSGLGQVATSVQQVPVQYASQQLCEAAGKKIQADLTPKNEIFGGKAAIEAVVKTSCVSANSGVAR